MIYLVCRTMAETDSGNVFEVFGAFSTEEIAVANCRPGEWIGPLPLDARLPDEPVSWPGAYYPHAAE